MRLKQKLTSNKQISRENSRRPTASSRLERGAAATTWMVVGVDGGCGSTIRGVFVLNDKKRRIQATEPLDARRTKMQKINEKKTREKLEKKEERNEDKTCGK